MTVEPRALCQGLKLIDDYGIVLPEATIDLAEVDEDGNRERGGGHVRTPGDNTTQGIDGLAGPTLPPVDDSFGVAGHLTLDTPGAVSVGGSGSGDEPAGHQSSSENLPCDLVLPPEARSNAHTLVNAS